MRSTTGHEGLPAAPPRLRGRYQLQRQLDVTRDRRRFLAFDMRLRRWCAVHVPKARVLRESTGTARFVRQAETLAALHHPNVLQVLDLDSDGALPFAVTELARGGSLGGWLRHHGRMGPRLACDVTGLVATGLAAVHQAGMVHGTLQPKRVLIHAEGRVVITDLGVSGPSDDLAFVAPEVRNRSRHTQEAAADLYALGALLFTLISGETREELFYAEAYEGLLSGVPTPLRAVILRACSVNPDDRYRDATDFIRGLRGRAARLPEAVEQALVEPFEALPPDPYPSVTLDRGLKEIVSLLGSPRGQPRRLMAERVSTLGDEPPSEDSLPSLPYRMPNPDRIDPGFRDPFEALSEEDVPAYVAPEGRAAWRQQVNSTPDRPEVMRQPDGTLDDRPKHVAAGPMLAWRWVRSAVLLASSITLAVLLVVGAAVWRVAGVQARVGQAGDALVTEVERSPSVLSQLVEAGANEAVLVDAWSAFEDAETPHAQAQAAAGLVRVALEQVDDLEASAIELDRWERSADAWEQAEQARTTFATTPLGRLTVR